MLRINSWSSTLHLKAVDPLTLGRLPWRPDACDAKRAAVCGREPGRDVLACTPVRLIDGLARDDAVLALGPRVLEAGQAGNGLAARVVRAYTVLYLFGEAGQEAEMCVKQLKIRHRLIAGILLCWTSNDRCFVSRVNMRVRARFVAGRKGDAEASFQELAALFGLAVAAHCCIVRLI